MVAGYSFSFTQYEKRAVLNCFGVCSEFGQSSEFLRLIFGVSSEAN